MFKKGLHSQLNVKSISIGVIDFSAARRVCVLYFDVLMFKCCFKWNVCCVNEWDIFEVSYESP